MKHISAWLNQLPAIIASPLSIFIFLFLFVYLFIFGLIGFVIPAVEPSANAQLIFGNYTNVLSALGAALAAGAGAKHTKSIKELHQKHEEIQSSVNEIHNKLDVLTKMIDKK